MRKIDLFAKNELSESETDELLRDMLQKTLGKQQKEQWSRQLESQYGIVREFADAGMNARMPALVWRWAAALALIVTAAAGLWYWFPQGHYQQLADQVLEVEKVGYADLRKGETNLINTRLQAVEAYQQGNYVAAIQQWQALQQTPFFEADDQFYLALSYLYAGAYEKAYQAFERHAGMIQSGGRFEAEAAFFKAITLLKLNRKPEAEQILTILQSTTTSAVMQRKTADLLKNLK